MRDATEGVGSVNASVASVSTDDVSNDCAAIFVENVGAGTGFVWTCSAVFVGTAGEGASCALTVCMGVGDTAGGWMGRTVVGETAGGLMGHTVIVGMGLTIFPGCVN